MKIVMVLILLVGCGGNKVNEIDVIDQIAVEIVSHRGINAKDNTIKGFYNAINLGFDSIETDLRMKNGVVVLSHDKTLDSETYDTFEDLLYFASNNNVKIWIEAKETEVIKPALELLNQFNITVNFSSFKQSDVDLIKSINPSIETGRIITREHHITTVDADWIIIPFGLIKDNYDSVKKFKIAAWTFKNQNEFEQVKEFIDAAVSDIELIQKTASSSNGFFMKQI